MTLPQALLASASAVYPGAGHGKGEGRYTKTLLLVAGLGALSWIATYVGMVELIAANMGALPLSAKIMVGCSVTLLTITIIYLLDTMFSPIHGLSRACVAAGYLLLSIVSVSFGFAFYCKILEYRSLASRAASSVTQAQTSLFDAAMRLKRLEEALLSLSATAMQKADIERSSGKSCPNGSLGYGARRKMRDEDAARFKSTADIVKGRIGAITADMTALQADMQSIIKDGRIVIDPRRGNGNDVLRSLGSRLEPTVAGFNALRSDVQLRQIRSELAIRVDKKAPAGRTPAGRIDTVVIACPDPQLDTALRDAVRAIDQLPELGSPKIAAVDGSQATIAAFRRLTTSAFDGLSFLPLPSADKRRELQKKTAQALAGYGLTGQAQSTLGRAQGGLVKSDNVPLALAVLVDLCLLLVSMGRPLQRSVAASRGGRAAQMPYSAARRLAADVSAMAQERPGAHRPRFTASAQLPAMPMQWPPPRKPQPLWPRDGAAGEHAIAIGQAREAAFGQYARFVQQDRGSAPPPDRGNATFSYLRRGASVVETVERPLHAADDTPSVIADGASAAAALPPAHAKTVAAAGAPQPLVRVQAPLCHVSEARLPLSLQNAIASLRRAAAAHAGQPRVERAPAHDKIEVEKISSWFKHVKQDA
jgi:hypothetical protein